MKNLTCSFLNKITRAKAYALCIFLFYSIFMLTNCHNSTGKWQHDNHPSDRNDSWGFAGFGGGGAMFYPALSPHNTDIAMVACDMTGSFVTYDGGMSWRMFCLRGPVKFFVFDPLD